MATYRPIQQRLLIHTVTHKEKLMDSFFDEEYGLGIDITNVRVEPKDKFTRVGNEETVVANYLIFIDMFYSKPLRDIKNEDLIIFNNKELKVVEVNELYDSSKLHHLEVWCKG